MTEITQVHPDFDGAVEDLQTRLRQKGTWNEMLPADAGQTLIEIGAAGVTFNQFAIEQSIREAFPDNAQRESSIYAVTRMLGVRIARKLPASYSVNMFNEVVDSNGVPQPFSIPPYSQFKIGGSLYYNRDTISLPAGGGGTYTIHQGEIRQKTFISTGEAFQEFYLDEQGFVVANDDVSVTVRNPNSGSTSLWLPTDEPLWLAGPDDLVYYDNTSGLGDAILTFGNSTHGSVPPVNHEIVVTYPVTNGASQTISLLATDVVLVSNKDIRGRTINASSGGDEKPPIYYKTFGSQIHRARGRAISVPDYRAIIIGYPGVADVIAQGQRDIAPGDPTWMNVVRVCVLPQDSDDWGGINPNPTSPAWEVFMEWLSPKLHGAVQVQKYNPSKIPVEIQLNLVLFPQAKASETVTKARAAITALFDKGPTTLGKRISLSDIITASKVEGVDYVELLNPTADIVPSDKLRYVTLSDSVDEPIVITPRYTERTIS
jgi:hypothetical protein